MTGGDPTGGRRGPRCGASVLRQRPSWSNLSAGAGCPVVAVGLFIVRREDPDTPRQEPRTTPERAADGAREPDTREPAHLFGRQQGFPPACVERRVQSSEPTGLPGELCPRERCRRTEWLVHSGCTIQHSAALSAARTAVVGHGRRGSPEGWSPGCSKSRTRPGSPTRSTIGPCSGEVRLGGTDARRRCQSLEGRRDRVMHAQGAIATIVFGDVLKDSPKLSLGRLGDQIPRHADFRVWRATRRFFMPFIAAAPSTNLPFSTSSSASSMSALEPPSDPIPDRRRQRAELGLAHLLVQGPLQESTMRRVLQQAEAVAHDLAGRAVHASGDLIADELLLDPRKGDIHGLAFRHDRLLAGSCQQE
jgi:hypothetical protein